MRDELRYNDVQCILVNLNAFTCASSTYINEILFFLSCYFFILSEYFSSTSRRDIAVLDD